MTDNNARSIVEVSVLGFVFVCLTLLVFAFRDAEVLTLISEGKAVSTSEYSWRGGLCSHLPSCLRVGDAWVGVALERVLVLTSQVLDMLPDRHRTEALSIPVKESYLVVMSVVVTRMLGLVPILVAAFFAYKSTILRLLLMVAAFMSIFGWARSGPLFTEQGMGASDFTTIGFLFLLFVLISRGFMRSFVAQAVALIAGQLIFENLGIVTGVAVVVYGFAMNQGAPLSPRAAAATTRLLGLAGVSLATLATLYLAIIGNAAPGQEVGPVGGGGLLGYFVYTFDTFGRINIQEFHDIRENFVEIMAYPLASGLVLGLLAAFAFGNEGRDREVLGNQFWAAFALWIGFMCTVVIGFFLSGLYYEMGRQLVPLCTITTLVFAKGVELIVARSRTGH